MILQKIKDRGGRRQEKDITSGSAFVLTKCRGTGRDAWAGLVAVDSITKSLREGLFLLVLILRTSKRFKIPFFDLLDSLSPSGGSGEDAKAGGRKVGGSGGCSES
jgi:hypothetical protein